MVQTGPITLSLAMDLDLDLDLDGTTNHLLTANDDARFSDEISMVLHFSF